MSASLDLARRAVACKGWRLMPGMRFRRNRWGNDWPSLRVVEFSDRESPERVTCYGDALPDLDDPATLGCLLALVREAWPAGCIVDILLDCARVTPMGVDVPETIERPTLAEALVAALEAAP